MERSKILALVLRVFQFIFAAVALGISVKEYKLMAEVKAACKEYAHDSSSCSNFGGFYPAIGFAAFTGAWGLVSTAIGLVSAFVDFIPWIVVLVTEGLATLFYLAAGVRVAVLNTQPYLCEGGGACYYFRTDAAFLLLGFIASLAALIMIIVVRRQSGGKVRSVV